MSYYILILVLLQKLSGRGESDLVDVLVNLLGSHAYTVVDYLEGLFLLIQLDTDF